MICWSWPSRFTSAPAPIFFEPRLELLERHLSKRKRQPVAIKKKIGAANFRATHFERIKKNIFRASGKAEKNQEISSRDRIFSGRPGSTT